jgi:hypothetical protein
LHCTPSRWFKNARLTLTNFSVPYGIVNGADAIFNIVILAIINNIEKQLILASLVLLTMAVVINYKAAI